jgi:hypothetical protein
MHIKVDLQGIPCTYIYIYYYSRYIKVSQGISGSLSLASLGALDSLSSSSIADAGLASMSLALQCIYQRQSNIFQYIYQYTQIIYQGISMNIKVDPQGIPCIYIYIHILLLKVYQGMSRYLGVCIAGLAGSLGIAELLIVGQSRLGLDFPRLAMYIS